MAPQKTKMIALGLRQQRFNGRTTARHLRIGETRVFGFDDAREMVDGKRHVAFFGSATIMSSSMRAPGDDS